MSKLAYFTVLSVVVLIVLTAINIHGVNASEEIKFVPVPVLAQDQSNYAVDENVSLFHRVSADIVIGAAEDMTPPDSVTTIPYTIVPPDAPAPSDSDEPQTVDKPDKEHGNNGNGGPKPKEDNPNGNGNENGNGNDNGNDHGKDNGKDNNKDDGKGVDDKPSKPPKN